ncbi:MAG: TonB C-terminal domain-containing protein [Limisphaerales bacterium]
MNERLKRKCLFVSVGMHALLVVIVAFASAFKSEVKEPDIKPMTVIDTDVINRLMAAPAPVVAPQPVQRPAPTPTPRKVEPPKPAPKKPEPPKPAPKKPDPPKQIKKPDPKPPKKITKKPDPKPAPKRNIKKPVPKKPAPKKPTPRPTPRPRPTVKIDTSALRNKLNNRPDPAAQRRERERAEQRRKEAAAAERRRVAALKSKLGSITKLDSRSVKVSAGSSARASIDYGTYVRQTYDRHWSQPSGLRKGLRAEITVTIRRDGSVKSARVSKRSGVALFDNALQSLANKVRSFRSFPSNMTVSEKTFSCGFEVE